MGGRVAKLPTDSAEEDGMIVNTKQDMRTISTGFHVIELHSRTVLWGSTVMTIVAAVAVGAYLMWRRARRKAVAREGALRMEQSRMMEHHLRMELGASAHPGEGAMMRDEGTLPGGGGSAQLMLPQALPPVRADGTHRRPSSGYVPRI